MRRRVGAVKGVRGLVVGQYELWLLDQMAIDQLFVLPGIKGEARRAAPARPLGQALLQPFRLEIQWDGLNHKAPRTSVEAPTRRTDAALCCK
jgi:hypothetical protein